MRFRTPKVTFVTVQAIDLSGQYRSGTTKSRSPGRLVWALGARVITLGGAVNCRGQTGRPPLRDSC
jgi:hypothetical protein